ncbi:MAG: hypothetical protein ACRDOT_05860 [Aeromicrobium sp.]
MKASALPAAAVAVAVLVGCSASDEPGDTSESSSPEAAASSAKPSSDSPGTAPPIQDSFQNPADSAKPDIPNIALRKDGKTPFTCAEWPGLSDDRQRDLVFSALVQAVVVPVTDAKVNEARQKVDTDCKSEPRSAAYVVALRAAMSV